MDPPRVLTYPRRPGVDSQVGKKYESDLHALVYIRLQKLFQQQEDGNFRVKNFSLLNNVDKIGSFDDVVARLEYETNGELRTKVIFIQCKHVQDLPKNSTKKFDENLLKERGVISLFESFLSIRKILEKNPIKIRKLNDSDEQARKELSDLFQCDFQDCEFIFFTNIDVDFVFNDDSKYNMNKYKLEETKVSEGIDVTKYLLNSDSGKVLEINLGMNDFTFLKEANAALKNEFSIMFRVFTNQPSTLELSREIENYDWTLRDVSNVAKVLEQELGLISANPTKDIASTSSNTVSVTNQEHKVLTENDNLILRAESFNKLGKKWSSITDRLKEKPILKRIFSTNSIYDVQSKLSLKSPVQIETKFSKLEKLKLQQFVIQTKNQLLIFMECDNDTKNWLSARESLLYLNITKVFICFDAALNFAIISPKSNETFITIIESELEYEARPWDQFSRDAREYIVDCKFRFQTDEKVKLGDLCGERCGEILDEDSICKILNGNFEIRQTLPETSLYVSRRLQMTVCSDETIEILKHEKPKNSKFVVFSDAGQPLPGRDNESKLYFDDVDNARNCISKIQRSVQCNGSNKDTYHLCAFEDQRVKLIYTIGKQRSCCGLEIIKDDELFTAATTKVTILCDVAGMGKTTTMKYLAENFKKKNPSHWVYFIQLNNFVDKLANPKNFCDQSTALNFLLSDLLGLTDIALKLFLDSCKESGNVALFLDGFDEINPGAEKTFTSLLNSLQGSTIKRIFVSSRPSFVKVLENAYMQSSVIFNKFDTDEKRLLLTLYWKQEMESRKMPVNDKKLASMVDITIAALENEEHVLNEILETPLLIRMIAEGYFETLLKSLNENVTFKLNVNLFNLYEMFIEAHVKQHFEKTEMKLNKLTIDERPHVIQEKLRGLSELACSIILPKALQKNTNIETGTTKQLLRLGLLTNEHPPVFIHRTIAEYLAANIMIDEILSKQPDSESTAVSIMSVFLDHQYSVLRTFLESLLNMENLPVYFNDIGTYVKFERILQQKETPLHIAAIQGNYKLIQAFLKRDNNLLNLKDFRGQTALHCACNLKKMEVIHCLIKTKDCILNTVDKNGKSVLHTAAEKGILDVMKLILKPAEFAEADLQQIPGTVEILNTHDGQPGDAASFINLTNNFGETPLHLAVGNRHIDAVKLLIQNKYCLLNLKSMFGGTVLNVATEKKYVEIMKLLMDRDRSIINIADEFDKTPIYIAIKNTNIEAVQLLLKYNFDVKNIYRENSALHVATSYGNSDIIECLIEHDKSMLNQPNKRGVTPIHAAVFAKNIETFKSILKHADREGVTLDFSTALKIAVTRRYTKTIAEIIELLIQCDESIINCRDKYGATPLHHTAKCRNVGATKQLLQYPGCAVDISDKNSEYAIHAAARSGCTEIMKMLLQRNKSLVNAQNSRGETPLIIAGFKSNLNAIKLLIRQTECNVSKLDNESNSIFHATCASTELFSLNNFEDDSLDTCLEYVDIDRELYEYEYSRGKVGDNFDSEESSDAVAGCHFDSDDSITDKNFVADNSENSKFYESSSQRSHQFSQCQIEILTLLVQLNRTQLYMQNCKGQTPLHLACYVSDVGLVKYLLDQLDCLTNILDTCGNSIFHAACFSFFPSNDLVELLLDHNKQLINVKNDMGMAPLHVACGRFDFDIISGYNQYFSPLHTRILYYYERKSKIVHEYIARLNTILQHDPSQLNMQTHRGDTALHLACSSGNIDAVKFLLSIKNCSTHKRDKYGNTAFHHAAANARTEIVELLWQHRKSQINKKNNDGNTALHLLFFNFNKETSQNTFLYNDIRFARMYNICIESFLGSAKFILHHKYSQIIKKNTLGRTPLHIFCASDNTDKIRLLLKQNDFLRGLSYYCLNSLFLSERSYSIRNFLEEEARSKNLEFNPRDNDPSAEQNAKRPGCSREQTFAFNLLLANQLCSVKEQDNFGYTALHYAAFYNRIETMELLLLRDNSVLHVKSWKGKTALHVARIAGRTDAAIFLADIDFSLNFRDNICNLIIHYAAWKQQIDGMELLQRLGKIKQDKKTKLIVTCSKGFNCML